jgi:hypothetical protein
MCVEDRLIPDANEQIRVCSADGFGVFAHRCELTVGRDQYVREVLELLEVAARGDSKRRSDRGLTAEAKPRPRRTVAPRRSRRPVEKHGPMWPREKGC